MGGYVSREEKIVCPVCPSGLSGWRGYFQDELTRTEGLRYGQQQAPHQDVLFQLMQNSGLRTQSPRTGADRGWRVAAHLRQWALGRRDGQ